MRSRAFRRQQKLKALNRARRKWGGWMSEANIKKAANHRTLCSCPMCGNPRRWFGEEKPSLQRKAERDEDRIREALEMDP